MEKNKPLDIRLLNFVAVEDDCPQLEIVRIPDQGNDTSGKKTSERKHRKLADYELEDKIKKHRGYLKQVKLKDTTKLQKALDDFEEEQKLRAEERAVQVARVSKPVTKAAGKHDGANGVSEEPERRVIRTRAVTLNQIVSKNASKTDCSEKSSRGHVSNLPAFGDEIEILNPSKGKGPFSHCSTISEGSFYEGTKDKSRVYSGEQAGPSSRQGLRSGHLKPCNQCKRRVSPTNLQSIGDGEDAGLFCISCSRKQFGGLCNESPESCEGTQVQRIFGGKRSRQSSGLGEPMQDAVVEIFSSEDEEDKETRDMVAACRVSNVDQRRGPGLRNTVARRMDSAKIAYPSRDDPEAVEVHYHDLHRLEPLEFLNDTVIDFYIKYIQRPEVLEAEQKNKFHFFNSFFYKKLSEILSSQNKKHSADLSKLRKWTKGTNIFEKDYLFVPVHDKWHWSLAIVCHPGASHEDSSSERCILHLDSMSPGHKSPAVFRLLRAYLVAEWAHQAEEDGVCSSFQRISADMFSVRKIQVPQQENESDCGLFLLHYIECFLKEAPATFKLADLEQRNLFGRNWFRPSQASSLRERMRDLLEKLFDANGAKANSDMETFENLELEQESSDGELLVESHVSDSEASGGVEEVPKPPLSPGQSSATELVIVPNVIDNCVSVNSSSGASTRSGSHVDYSEKKIYGRDSMSREELSTSRGEIFADGEITSGIPSSGVSLDIDLCVDLSAREKHREEVAAGCMMESHQGRPDSSDHEEMELFVELVIQPEGSSGEI